MINVSNIFLLKIKCKIKPASPCPYQLAGNTPLYSCRQSLNESGAEYRRVEWIFRQKLTSFCSWTFRRFPPLRLPLQLHCRVEGGVRVSILILEIFKRIFLNYLIWKFDYYYFLVKQNGHPRRSWAWRDRFEAINDSYRFDFEIIAGFEHFLKY